MPSLNPYTLITGASSGLGRSIAVRLSGKRRLILNGRNPARLQETLQDCINPDQHIVWQYDLAEIPSISANLSQIIADSNIAIDCFVHAAGVLKILPVRSAT